MMVVVPFAFECSRESGFVMDPNEHATVGYVTSLKLGSVALAQDLKVSVPFNNGALPTGMTGLQRTGTAPDLVGNVTGVIETFQWNGGVADPLHLEFYVSQENATQVKSLVQGSLATTEVPAFSWWIADYDQEAKVWYEAAFPAGNTVSGMIANKDNPALKVDLNPVSANGSIDVNVYKVSVSVAPGANKQYQWYFANSSAKQVVKSWGHPPAVLPGRVLAP